MTTSRGDARHGRASPHTPNGDTARRFARGDLPRRTAPYDRILRRNRYNALFGESVAGLDTEAFRVVVSSLSWCVNERRVSGVAVTRHSMFVVSSVLIGTVDVYGKLDDPAMTVEFSRQLVLDDTTPSVGEFLLNRRSPSDESASRTRNCAREGV